MAEAEEGLRGLEERGAEDEGMMGVAVVVVGVVRREKGMAHVKGEWRGTGGRGRPEGSLRRKRRDNIRNV